MTKLVLSAALAASFLVPAGGVALAIAVATAPPPRYDADDPRPPNQFDRANLEAIYVELVALDRTGTPGSPGHIAAVRGIARDARAWAVQFEAEPEWEEFALATSALAALIAEGLENPERFSSAAYARATERAQAAAEAALPVPLDGP